MNETTNKTRTGTVLIKAGFSGRRWQYSEVAVREEPDGALYYYHGGPTCCTSDGWVKLSEEYRDKIVWRD